MLFESEHLAIFKYDNKDRRETYKHLSGDNCAVYIRFIVKGRDSFTFSIHFSLFPPCNENPGKGSKGFTMPCFIHGANELQLHRMESIRFAGGKRYTKPHTTTVTSLSRSRHGYMSFAHLEVSCFHKLLWLPFGR